MGLFDSVLGAVAGKIASEAGVSNPLVGALGGLLNQNGGVQGLMSKFEQNGLGSTFSSWVGTEANQAVSPDQIQKVLGSGQINELASKLGVDPATASSFLAQHLPMIINQLTPNGQAQPGVDHHEAIASLLPTLIQGFQQAAGPSSGGS